ncbi:hypothetical protein BDA96_06G083200 [Sorghum bicolor]|uniref:VQ domain-containing protein n=1 Tax=Sorghum bicolor TaxID=4558 RepID=A0A921UCQ6_SORBI|nr:hypothetical protein BDA96_06G083200 [Sorghum bicolor]
MLNHSHSRPDSRSPFLHHGHAHAAADTEHHRGAQQGMDPPSSSGRTTPTTPRRQLQGPRPPRLNVRMESHAIKKPSGSGSSGVVPPGGQGHGRPRDHHHPQQPGGRAPVIIYDASPKVIHAKPSEFMALVQRLTGPGAGGSGSATPPDAQAQQSEAHHHMVVDGGGGDDNPLLGQAFLPPELLLSPSAAMSPAARLATIERSVRGPMPSSAPAAATDYDVLDAQTGGLGGGGDDDGTLAAVLGPALRHPSILSPLPSSLPPAAASGLFSPLPFDASSISWLNELSPILRAAAAAAASTANAGAGASSSGGFGPGGATSNGGGGSRQQPPAYYSDPFVPSPRNLLATPTVPSPATCAEFFGSLPDL